MRSPLGDIFIPDDVPLTELMLHKMKQHRTVTALIDGASGRKWTYSELSQRIIQLARSLHSRGFRKGDIVFLCSRNCIEYPVVFLAVTHLGGTLTTCNPQYTVEEILNQMMDARPTYAVTGPGEVSIKVKAACSRYGKVQELFVIGHSDGCTPLGPLLNPDQEILGSDTANQSCQENVGEPIDVKNDVAAILYSSGTTGLPKGVMLTHYSIVANVYQCCHPAFRTAQEEQGQRDVMINVLPLFHVYGFLQIQLGSFFKGNTLLVLPKFHLDTFLVSIQDYKVTFIYAVPPMIVLLAKYPDLSSYNLSSVKTINYGAAPLGRHLVAEIKARLGDVEMRQSYGMTETSPVTLCQTRHGAKHGSVGVLLPSTECKIVDIDTKKSLGSNENGELLVRGPQVMKGYLRKPKATEETIDRGGWLHTGDIGYYDDEGYFYVVDRLKEVIKYKGFQVAPAEIENLLMTQPGVSDAAVIGVPDELAGELPKAFVVRKHENYVTARDLQELVAGKMAPHKHLRGGVEFLQEIPKSPSGKILRRKLQEMLKAKL